MLFGQCNFYIPRAEFDRARETGEELIRLGDAQGDHLNQAIGHRVIGVSLFHRGELFPSRQHFQQALALHDAARTSTVGFFADARVVSLSYLSTALLICGLPDQARLRVDEALTRARILSHPSSIAYAHSYYFLLHEFCGDVKAAWAESEAYAAVATEQGLAMLVAEATLARGWALAQMGEPIVGISLAREGLVGLLATGCKFFMPLYRSQLVDAYRMGERPKSKMLHQLHRAILQAERGGERWFNAELYRRRGELLTCGVDPDPIAAEADFRRAIAIAGAQRAKLWELRAATSLGDLLRDQGKRAEACDLVGQIYAWFTEGLDTPVLMEAKGLLDSVR